MSKELTTVGKALGFTVALTLINCILLVSSYLLPTSAMRDHVADSKQLILSEELYHRWDWGYTTTQIDGQSEYDLYGMAINEDSQESAIEKAMFMRYPDGDGLPRNESILAYADRIDGNYDQRAYTRYWNGSVMFLKVLLLFFNISDIRMINFMFQLTILLIIVCLMAKRKMERYVVPFIASIIFVNPFTMALSVKFAAEYVPMLLALLVILVFGERIDRFEGGWDIFFALVGSVTAFMCMLSFPGITLGIPLLMYVWHRKEKDVIKTVIRCCLFWGGAYGVTWLLKWVIGTITTSYNFLEDAFGQVLLYHNESSISIIVDRLMRNLWCIYNPVYVSFFVAMVIWVCIMAVRSSKNQGEELQSGKDTIAGYILIALIPVMIIVAMGNGYANVHFYMAHRHFAISVSAVLCLLQVLIFEISRKKEKR